MDQATLSSLSNLAGLVAPLCIVGLFVWAILRTGSRHALRFRLWQLIHGNREISDAEIAAYIREQNSLMSFRFIAGVHVRDLESARQLIRWTKLNKVEMQHLRMAGDYFDPDLRVISRVPPKRLQILKLLLASLAGTVLIGLFFVLYTGSAVLTIKATNRSLLMTESGAKTLWPLTQSPLSKASCMDDASAESKHTSFTDAEGQVLCKIMTAPEAATFLKDAVKTQRTSWVILMTLTFVAVCYLLWSYLEGLVVSALAKRHIDPKLGDEKPASDADDEG